MGVGMLDAHAGTLGYCDIWKWDTGVAELSSQGHKWHSKTQSLHRHALHAMEGLIGSSVGIQHLHSCIPLLWSALHHLRNVVLNVSVQALPEFYDNEQAVGVACLLYQFRELINIVIHRLLSLVVPCQFQFGESYCCFILQTEFGDEVQLKSLPWDKGWKSLWGFPSENVVCVEGSTSGLHKGQGPVNLSLIILELILAQGDEESARIEKRPGPWGGLHWSHSGLRVLVHAMAPEGQGLVMVP